MTVNTMYNLDMFPLANQPWAQTILLLVHLKVVAKSVLLLNLQG